MSNFLHFLCIAVALPVFALLDQFILPDTAPDPHEGPGLEEDLEEELIAMMDDSGDELMPFDGNRL